MGFPSHGISPPGISTPWDFPPMGFPPHGISTPLDFHPVRLPTQKFPTHWISTPIDVFICIEHQCTACVYIHMLHIDTHVCIYIYTHTYCIYIHGHTECVYTRRNYTYICIYIYVYCIHMYTLHTHIYIYIFIHVYMCCRHVTLGCHWLESLVADPSSDVACCK